MTKTNNSKRIQAAILSLSLLTVMAGAAVAPALQIILEYFHDVDQTLVQMIISIPALFIALTGFVFPTLCRTFKSKTLVMIGLLLYTAGGCMAGLFSNIYAVLAFRALVGIGVGIIMPLSTGLLSFYFPPEEQDKLMGYSSAMNQMGGVVATLISGILASISWRASFLVYLMGVISIVLCLLFLPNDRIGARETKKNGSPWKQYSVYIIAIFLLMFTFFIYPSAFAIETAKAGVIPQKYVSVIMAGMDLVAFLGGLAFVSVKAALGEKAKFLAPILFCLGYLFLSLGNGWIGVICGSVLIGFANGVGIPYIISSASRKAGPDAAATVMPLISMSMYFAQFVTPMVLSVVGSLFAWAQLPHLSYAAAFVSGVMFLLWSSRIKSE